MGQVLTKLFKGLIKELIKGIIRIIKFPIKLILKLLENSISILLGNLLFWGLIGLALFFLLKDKNMRDIKSMFGLKIRKKKD